IKGTFAYLIGDSFAKLGLGMIADGTPVFGLTGWAGTFAALDAAAVAKNFDTYGLGDKAHRLPVSEVINNYQRSEVIDPLTVK
ncbi:hypothetical protein K4G90_24185, partial [Mycobacterium tuberculosis]|nr:hypothetical protein [Mycobacterium tuberculosis]